MSMMETVSPQGTTNSAMAVPGGMYGEDGISRFISDFVAHSSRRCPKIPPMTGRCMQTAVAL